MKKITKTQLNHHLKTKSEKLHAAVQTALESLTYSQTNLNSEMLTAFLQMLEPEAATHLSTSYQQIDKDDTTFDVFIQDNTHSSSLEFTTKEGEPNKIILIENDLHLSGDIFIEDRITLIVTANITAKNVVVNGSLYTSGNLNCELLFGASSNDHETYIGKDISTTLIAENGHYTVAEGNIYAQHLMSFNNTIEGKTAMTIEGVSLDNEEEAILFYPNIPITNGYFDEKSFLLLIKNQPINTFFA
ncbi:hypothetical protein [Flavobacterium sp. NKUCC04_CG]|uniref:hypothetical protein n=1 Tax=Flavobacterium sp. NKUCC04_CG TaxID=2842121 RepID=UPI001C5AD15A|nr:hypothetical protein [Flavobacterium sp. NKUCC04_CG]MBW3518456.1 hypothetical protein [Flavobacterium sp. NKUCC04_CG]